MKSYNIYIDRSGSLELSINDIDLADYRKIIKKMQDNNIDVEIIVHQYKSTIFKSKWENKEKIKQIMTEMSIEEQDISIPENLPSSVTKKSRDFIKVKSFSFGDLEIETKKFDYVFSELTRRIFQDRISFDGENSYIVSRPDRNLFKWYLKALNESGFNTSSLTPIINLIPEVTPKNINPAIVAEEVDIKNLPWNIRISVSQAGGNIRNAQNELKRIIIFLFSQMTQNFENPNKEDNSAESSYSNKTYFYLNGKYKDLKNLQLVLEKNNFNTYSMGKVISDMVASGKIIEEKLEGELYGFSSQTEIGREIEKYERRFFAKNKDLDEREKHFFPAQRAGIRFLFTRSSALLGDEAGVGKTLQTITAASIKMKFDSRACLIITKSNSLVNQIHDEIIRIVGENPNNISRDWGYPKKWTILPYHIFGDIDSRKEATLSLVRHAKNNFFQVCILDEIHEIKNGEPTDRNKYGYLEHENNHTTFNVQEITKNIPTVWGASATIIANRPIDMLNQLIAINHPMGNMNYKDFLRYFDDRESSEEDQQLKADMIKDILIQQGVYIRRSKKEVNPNIPEMSMQQVEVPFSTEVIRKINEGITARNSLERTSILRQKIAVAKTQYTVSEAQKIIMEGKKVAIFTAYPGEVVPIIKKRLKQIIDFTYPEMGFDVAEIHGEQEKDERENAIREFKSKDSKYLAIIIGIKAGGTGLDFPNVADDVIINDFDWTPASDSQSIARFHRINSKNPVNIRYIIAINTEDKRNFELLQAKKQIAERIQNLDEEERKAVSSNTGNVQEVILKIRKEKYKQILKLGKLKK